MGDKDVHDLATQLAKQRISPEDFKQKDYERECEEFLRSKNIPFGATKVQRSPPGQVEAKESRLIRTNLYKIAVKEEKRIIQSRVELIGYQEPRDGNAPRAIPFNGDGIDPYFRVERRATCGRIFDAFVERNQNVFPPREKLYFDQQFDLFSTEKIRLAHSLVLNTEEVFPDDFQNLILRAAFRRCVRFELKVEHIKTIPTSELVEVMANRFDEQSLEIVRFVNISTSQHVFAHSEQYTNFANGLIYMRDYPPSFQTLVNLSELPGRVFIAAGLRKSSKIVGQGTKYTRSFTVSPKLSLFYRPEGLLASFKSLLQRNDVNQIGKMVKNLYVCPAHLLNRENGSRFILAKIIGLGKSASEETFLRDQQRVTVADHFENNLGIPLENRNYPVLYCKQGGKEVMYPFDVCEIMDMQRVSTNALNAELTSALIREAATLPDLLQRRINDCFAELNLVNSLFMQNAGMEVSSQPVELEAPILQAPVMQYSRGGEARFDLNSGNWKKPPQPYVVSGQTVTWALYGLVRGAQNFSEQNLNEFGSKYYDECKRKGFNIAEPAECKLLDPIGLNQDKELATLMKQLFEYLKSNGAKFVMIVTNKDDIPVHSYLKTLEQEHGVITQNVTSKVALGTIGVGVKGPQFLSLENIINKTNVKLGGTNYHVSGQNRLQLGKEDLFIGFDVNQAAGGMKGETSSCGPPTVLGFAANDSNDPIGLTGDFVYHQSAARGNLASFERTMVSICARRKAINTPKRVFVYRSGCSDGDFQYVSRYELALLRKIIMQQFGASTQLVLCIVTKAHSMIFTPAKVETERIDHMGRKKAGAGVQNAPHGTLVNQEVVSSFYDEFYLSGAKALQGTSKFSRYVVICNDAKVDLASLQKISYDLCFAFQIISSPVSLPSPVMVASEYAKRGRNLYNSTLNARKIENAASSEELTEILSYNQLDERNKRVNA